MSGHKKKSNQGRAILLFVLGLVGLALLLSVLLRGNDVALFNPKGFIAQEEFKLMMISAAIMLSVAIPALSLLYFFAWKYRESNEGAAYEPDRHNGKFLVFSVWAIPGVFALALSLFMWPAAHRLDQHKAIASDAKPLTVQVIALRWKWLFIYPEQNIASLNYVQIPAGTPVQFELTADEAPMSSFWIPHLGGQLYAMTGHANLLNLMADTPGDYPGSSAEINGAGFAGMKFMARASSKEDFDMWASSVGTSSNALDSDTYEKLLRPSESNAAAFYSSPDAGLYGKVLNKYMGSHHHVTESKE